MKKLLMLILLSLLLVTPLYAQTTMSGVSGSGFWINKVAIASGSVTLANSRISAVNGIAFYDIGVANALTDYLNHLLVVKDSAKRAIQGYIKAAGTGETFSNLISGSTLNGNMETGDPPTGWIGTDYGTTLSGAADERTGGSGIQSLNAIRGTQDYAARQSSGSAANQLLFFGGYMKNITSTTAGFQLGASVAVLDSSADWKLISVYITATGNHNLWMMVTGSGNGRFDDVFVRRVLTPSATGVTITSTKGGATFNWEAKDASFNYNDASGYTYTIYAVQ